MLGAVALAVMVPPAPVGPRGQHGREYAQVCIRRGERDRAAKPSNAHKLREEFPIVVDVLDDIEGEHTIERMRRERQIEAVAADRVTARSSTDIQVETNTLQAFLRRKPVAIEGSDVE